MAEQPPVAPGSGAGQPPPAELPKGLAIAALVLGIVGLVGCVPYLSIPCAILGIVFGIIARNKAIAGTGGGKGMATAGLICGIIGIVLVILFLAGALAFLSFAGKHIAEDAGGFEGIREEMENATKEMREGLERQKTPGAGPTSMLEPLKFYISNWLV